MDFLLVGLTAGILGFLTLRARGLVSWVAGAALFLFIWAMIFAIVGRNDFVSLLFFATTLALLARQYLRRRGSSPDIPAH